MTIIAIAAIAAIVGVAIAIDVVVIVVPSERGCVASGGEPEPCLLSEQRDARLRVLHRTSRRQCRSYVVVLFFSSFSIILKGRVG